MEYINDSYKFDNNINEFNRNDMFALQLFKNKFDYMYTKDNKYILKYIDLFIFDNTHKLIIKENSKLTSIYVNNMFICHVCKSPNNVIYLRGNILTLYAKNVNDIFKVSYICSCSIRLSHDHISDIEEIIRMDNINELQKILAIDEHRDVYININQIYNELTLINFAELHGSIKCFKYLLLNDYYTPSPNSELCVVYGNNLEILHILEQSNRIDYSKLADSAIKLHKHDIIIYALNKLNESKAGNLLISSLISYDYYTANIILNKYNEILLHNSGFLKMIIKESYIYDYLKEFITYNNDILIISKNTNHNE